MVNRRCFLYRIFSWALIGILLFPPDMLLAATDTPPPKSYMVRIPSQMGDVKERYRGSQDKLVIHIQDAHSSYDAQRNIANIIESLVKDGMLDTVHIEGAEGEINLTPFRQFPVAEARRKAAEDMTAYGYLTGAELAAIGLDEDVQLFGAEDMLIYKRNLKKFQSVMKRRGDILAEIEKIEEILEELKVPVYPEALMAFDRKVEDYEASEGDFVSFAQEVIDQAEDAKIDQLNYPNIQLLAEALQGGFQDSGANLKDVEKERSRLVVDLMRHAKEARFTALLKEIENHHFTDSEEKGLLFDSFLIKQLRTYLLKEKDYPHFVAHAKFAERFTRVDQHALLDEVEALALEVQKRLASQQSETCLELVMKGHHLKLMRRLIELKVIPSQVAYYEENSERFSSASYLNFLRTETKKNGIRYFPSSRIVLIDEVLEVASEFYRFAKARSRILVNNTVNQMDFSGRDVVALVAGGYHTQDITEDLKKQGYSYLVVAPRIDQPELTLPYMERMLNVKNSAELRFESAFNTLVKEALLSQYHDLTAHARMIVFALFAETLGIQLRALENTSLSIADYKGVYAYFETLLRKSGVERVEETFFVIEEDRILFIVPEHQIVMQFFGDGNLAVKAREKWVQHVTATEIHDYKLRKTFTVAEAAEILQKNIQMEVAARDATLRDVQKNMAGALYAALKGTELPIEIIPTALGEQERQRHLRNIAAVSRRVQEMTKGEVATLVFTPDILEQMEVSRIQEMLREWAEGQTSSYNNLALQWMGKSRQKIVFFFRDNLQLESFQKRMENFLRSDSRFESIEFRALNREEVVTPRNFADEMRERVAKVLLQAASRPGWQSALRLRVAIEKIGGRRAIFATEKERTMLWQNLGNVYLFKEGDIEQYVNASGGFNLFLWASVAALYGKEVFGPIAEDLAAAHQRLRTLYSEASIQAVLDRSA